MCTYEMFRVIAFPVVIVAILASTSLASAQTQAFQDWRVDCPQKNACVAHFDTTGVQILIGRVAPNAAVRMALRFPVQTKMGEPVAMRLSNGWQAGLRINGCKKDFCEAAVVEKATNTAVTQLRSSHDGVVAYQLKDRILIVPFSLAGFADAMKAATS